MSERIIQAQITPDQYIRKDNGDNSFYDESKHMYIHHVPPPEIQHLAPDLCAIQEATNNGPIITTFVAENNGRSIDIEFSTILGQTDDDTFYLTKYATSFSTNPDPSDAHIPWSQLDQSKVQLEIDTKSEEIVTVSSDIVDGNTASDPYFVRSANRATAQAIHHGLFHTRPDDVLSAQQILVSPSIANEHLNQNNEVPSDEQVNFLHTSALDFEADLHSRRPVFFNDDKKLYYEPSETESENAHRASIDLSRPELEESQNRITAQFSMHEVSLFRNQEGNIVYRVYEFGHSWELDINTKLSVVTHDEAEEVVRIELDNQGNTSATEEEIGFLYNLLTDKSEQSIQEEA